MRQPFTDFAIWSAPLQPAIAIIVKRLAAERAEIMDRRQSVTSPVFLVGAERSGSTLLRLMLDCHPGLAVHGEFDFLVDLVTAEGQLPTRRKFVKFVSGDRVFLHWNLQLVPGLDFVGLANAFLDTKRAADGAKIAGATVHRHFDRLLHIWPDARFIHIVRDGRDVALSRIKMGWAGNLYTGIGEWVEVESLWAALAAKLTPERRITIHYEMLVEDARSELRRICQFLSVAFDDRMLDYDERSTYSRPVKGGSEKWRQLPPKMLAAAEYRAAPWLERRGYRPSQPARAPTKAQVLAFRLQDRMARVQFRRRRYGTRLWFQDILSRRLADRGWRESVRRRIHAIDDQHIK